MRKLSNEKASVFNARKWLLPFSLLLLIQLLCLELSAQTIKVSGTVRDSKGSPLEGVSVSVKENSTVATTNKDGVYSISVPDAKSVLVFSFVGFTNKQETVGSRTSINVALQASISDLDDVVVVGYGVQKKRDVSGAISTLSEKNIQARQPVNIFDAIQGAAPGVLVLSASGAPGDESQIRIRGASTLTDGAAVNPLYIVDGVPRDNINAINPNDIKSIEILKDAASAAIYGSRSANGVVIVTTKSGEAGKPAIGVNYLQAYSSLAHNVPQSNRLERQIWDRYRNYGLENRPNDSTAFNRNTDNDYQDLITQTAVRNQVDFSISGGSKNVKYFNGVQYLKDEGIILNSFYKRFSTRSNIDYQPSSKFNMSSRLNFTYTDRSNINEGKVIQQAMQRGPQMALYFPSGEYIFDNGGRKNPIAEAYYRDNETKQYRAVLYQGVDFKPTKNLTIHGDVSGDVLIDRTYTFNSKFLTTSNPQVSDGSDNTDMDIRVQGNLYGSYSKSFKGGHDLVFMLGGNFENNNGEETNIAGKYFVSESVTTLNAAGEYDLNKVYSRADSYSLLGMYTRLTYNYKGRYLMNATVRRDGSSRFGESNRWGNFPSVSLAWRISDERFMDWATGVMNDAKIRLSYGLTGNQAIGNYDAQNQLIFGSYTYNGVAGVRANTNMGNLMLKWESTTQKNIGIDLNFLGGRLAVSADAYIKLTKDLLYDAPLPLELGPTGVRMNYGSVQNKGFELMISGYPVRSKHVTWQTSVTYTRNKNSIVSLPPGGNKIDDIWKIQEGEEAGMFYGYKFLGIYQYDQSNAYTEDFKTRLIPVFELDQNGNVLIDKGRNPILVGYTMPDGTPYTGSVKQLKANGIVSKAGDAIWQNRPDEKGIYNDVISTEDMEVMGNGQPRWYGSWSNSVNYKQWSLSFSLYGSFGNKVYNEGRRFNSSFNNSNTTPWPDMIYSFWKYPGQITNSYSSAAGTTTQNPRISDKWLEDGSFLRLQSVRVGYSIPASIAKRFFMKSLNAFVYSNNLLTWTNYTGFDPEVNQTSVLKPGKDAGRYPRKREIGMGVNIQF